MNFADETLEHRKKRRVAHPFDDGYSTTAPVDAFGANAYGLHGMLDNVMEWCRDWFCASYADVETVHEGSGEIEPAVHRNKAVRGGSFTGAPGELRVFRRVEYRWDQKRGNLGIR